MPRKKPIDSDVPAEGPHATPIPLSDDRAGIKSLLHRSSVLTKIERAQVAK